MHGSVTRMAPREHFQLAGSCGRADMSLVCTRGWSSGCVVLGLLGSWGHNVGLWGRLLLAFRANLWAASQAWWFERCLPLHSLVISLLLKNQALPRSANINIMLLVCLMAMWLDCSSEGDDVCWAVVPPCWWCLDSGWWTRARSGSVAAACAGLGLTLV